MLQTERGHATRGRAYLSVAAHTSPCNKFGTPGAQVVCFCRGVKLADRLLFLLFLSCLSKPTFTGRIHRSYLPFALAMYIMFYIKGQSWWPCPPTVVSFTAVSGRRQSATNLSRRPAGVGEQLGSASSSSSRPQPAFNRRGVFRLYAAGSSASWPFSARQLSASWRRSSTWGVAQVFARARPPATRGGRQATTAAEH